MLGARLRDFLALWCASGKRLKGVQVETVLVGGCLRCTVAKDVGVESVPEKGLEAKPVLLQVGLPAQLEVLRMHEGGIGHVLVHARFLLAQEVDRACGGFFEKNIFFLLFAIVCCALLCGMSQNVYQAVYKMMFDL